MRCIVCGRTEEDVSKRSLEIAAQINKALGIITNKEEVEVLHQRIKKLDRISFTCVTISDKVFKMLEKYGDMEKTDKDHDCLICMHCKALVDTMSYEMPYQLQFTGGQNDF
jgi:hypothetical protein